MIDTYNIGGPGKLLIQFLNNGGLSECNPIVAGFWRGPEKRWQFREAAEATGVRFEILHQACAYDVSVIRAALTIVRKNDINIIETHGYKAHVVGLALKLMTKLSWVAVVHGWTRENIKVEVYNWIEKYVVRYADRIVAVSDNIRMKLHLGKAGSGRLMTITNAADLVDVDQKFVCQRTTYGILGNELLIVVVGRLSPEKGHRCFIDALLQVSGKSDSVKALFVGEGHERESLQKIIQQNGMEGKIFLTGYQEDVASFYHASDIVVLPSLQEGMPVVALEAMMFAKPVVASSVGGIPEVVLHGETGFLVEPQNPAALADALLSLINDPRKRKEFGLAGKKRVETAFDPKSRTQKFLAMYRDLLECPKSMP
jgi:glycosyltransferase involved in cell wall biosynthesis